MAKWSLQIFFNVHTSFQFEIPLQSWEGTDWEEYCFNIKKQMYVSFSCLCSLIDDEFCDNLWKFAVEITWLQLVISSVTLTLLGCHLSWITGNVHEKLPSCFSQMAGYTGGFAVLSLNIQQAVKILFVKRKYFIEAITEKIHSSVGFIFFFLRKRGKSISMAGMGFHHSPLENLENLNTHNYICKNLHGF